jgi:uncharacterized protein YndB with AHSA1/START domain
MNALAHGTFVIERDFDCTPEAAFAAYADVEQRSLWGVPSEDERIVYAEACFEVGGLDVYRCGPKEDLRYEGRVYYQDIVPDQRVVYLERVAAGSTLLSTSLITMEFMQQPGGTRLLLTAQLVSFVGEGMLQNAKRGTEAALGRLGRSLQGTLGSAASR